MQLIDTHSHLDAAEFDADREQVLARAQALGVVAQIVPAVSAPLWPKLRAVVHSNTGLYPAYGLHPCYLAQHRPEHLTQLRQWLTTESAVAVGECGLDFFLTELNPTEQEQYFLAQLRLARDLDLAVIVHARRAVDAVLKCIRRIGALRGVVHSFAGSVEQAQRLRELGFVVSFGHPLTYARAQRLHKLVRELPLDGFLLETDSPDQPGVAHRGQRNEPAFLLEVVQCVAQLRQQTPEQIAQVTYATASALFRLPALVHNKTATSRLD